MAREMRPTKTKVCRLEPAATKPWPGLQSSHLHTVSADTWRFGKCQGHGEPRTFDGQQMHLFLNRLRGARSDRSKSNQMVRGALATYR